MLLDELNTIVARLFSYFRDKSNDSNDNDHYCACENYGDGHDDDDDNDDYYDNDFEDDDLIMMTLMMMTILVVCAHCTSSNGLRAGHDLPAPTAETLLHITTLRTPVQEIVTPFLQLQPQLQLLLLLLLLLL